MNNNHQIRWWANVPALTLTFVISIALLATQSPLIAGSQDSKSLQTIDYKIGPKDLLEIKVFELPELNQTVRVAEDGSVSFSLLGRVEVSGLTAQELEEKLAYLLDQKYTKAAHVTVFIREYQKVTVFGAVSRPGNYEIVGPTTLLQLISQAGGLTPESMDVVYIFRQSKDNKQTKIAINLKELVSDGNPDLNIYVQPNDVINIPIDLMLTVYVYGEVRNPGAIQFRQSKNTTLLQAITQAGGTTEWASRSRVIIKRQDKRTSREMRINVNLKDVISGKTRDIILEDGDVIIVP